MKIESKLAQIGSTVDTKTGAVNFPIYSSTAFRHPGLGKSTGYDYIRTQSPTKQVLEEAFSELEVGDAAFACSSGMAALQTVLSLFSQGDHLIVSLDLYGGTYRLLEQIMSRFGITTTYADMRSIEQLESLYQPNTKALLIETPTNPLMMITDIAKVSAWAKEKNILVMVDNTLLTPFFQQPLKLGADIVVHSATKYLGGHNDVLAGLIAVKGEKLAEEIAFLHNSIGAVLSPHDCYLLMRGMKTLALRMERHQHNTQKIAEYLQTHPLITDVYYPGLSSHPDYEIQKKQATGNTGIFSFKVKHESMIAPILEHLTLIAFAESLGGVESLMTYPVMQTHMDIPEEIRNQIGVDHTLLRFSVGIEHVDDLIADLAQALDKAKEACSSI
ncbi:PLP-dependent transferase [Longirhabdus pacifica]|uniref:PLP-dependent transferase n=1 Tax=Longirhabdus pacifica TaxID=2305227 RepID=UPI001008B4CD|nr:PLP-dependent transferase [Longirhabdus pacifica]